MAEDSTVPGEMTRLNQFMADCMSVGALRGFKHFSMHIRSREEVILRVFRDSSTEIDSDVIPICSSTRMVKPFDTSNKSLEADEHGINFLIAGYQRYRCPYVWLRSHHQELVEVEDDQELDSNAPVVLNTINCWRYFDIRPWDVIVEIICYALNPWPENPFSIDYAYFDKITIEERVVATGAMLEFLRRAYLR
ncbi:hypothetical protein COEREDRAFT_62810, partial [Coemansia reversa NRRL 1564]